VEELGAESKNTTLERSIGWYTFGFLPVGTKRAVHCLEISSTDWRVEQGLPLTQEDRLCTNDIHQTHNILILNRDGEVADVYQRIGIGMIDSTLGEFDGADAITLTIL
jgi:hypothetical protein